MNSSIFDSDDEDIYVPDELVETRKKNNKRKPSRSLLHSRPLSKPIKKKKISKSITGQIILSSSDEDDDEEEIHEANDTSPTFSPPALGETRASSHDQTKQFIELESQLKKETSDSIVPVCSAECGGDDSSSVQDEVDAMWASLKTAERTSKQAPTSTKNNPYLTSSSSARKSRPWKPTISIGTSSLETQSIGKPNENEVTASEQKQIQSVHATVAVEKETIDETQHAKKKRRKELAGGLDSLLSALGPQKQMTAMDKTRIDWTRSKEETGDGHQLEQFVVSKDGYLEQTNFLLSADHREFEQELALKRKHTAAIERSRKRKEQYNL